MGSIEHLGQILLEQGKPNCIETLKDAYDLFVQIGDKPGAAVAAFHLGNAYTDILDIRNLDQAEYWYKQDLELENPRDLLARGGCLAQLGHVSYERFKEAWDAEKPEEELLQYLNTSIEFYEQALNLLPENSLIEQAVICNQLGLIYEKAGNPDFALQQYQESIRSFEIAENFYRTAQTRFNVAFLLIRTNRFDDALLYAKAALKNFEIYGDKAGSEIQKTQRLIQQIEQALAARENNP